MASISPSRVLITGSAGFVGMHVAARVLSLGHTVLGVDDLNDYYDPALKQARLETLTGRDCFTFAPIDIADEPALRRVFADFRPTCVIHLAAQPGVRYSIDHPLVYGRSNLSGFLNILEACRNGGVEHLVFASSSSVYGERHDMPLRESDRADQPISLYAATKRSNELMAHSYSHLYALPTTGLRFFTVYGPWGRPDMAVYMFTKAIFEGGEIKLFNEGDTWRDYTYVDDIADGVVEAALGAAGPPSRGEDTDAPYRLYNIGKGHPEQLGTLVGLLEEIIGRPAHTTLLPAQPGDVYSTFADVSLLKRDHGFAPSTSLREGLERFVDWYRAYHAIADTPD